MNSGYIVVNSFSNERSDSNHAEDAILFELEKSEGSPVSRKAIERKYRKFNAEAVKSAALNLVERGMIEILKKQGKGRPGYFFAKGANYGR